MKKAKQNSNRAQIQNALQALVVLVGLALTACTEVQQRDVSQQQAGAISPACQWNPYAPGCVGATTGGTTGATTATTGGCAAGTSPVWNGWGWVCTGATGGTTSGTTSGATAGTTSGTTSGTTGSTTGSTTANCATPRGSGFTTGATATVTFDASALDTFTGRRMNSVQNAVVNVDLRDVDTTSNQAFAGRVRLYYQELDSYGCAMDRAANFHSGSSTSDNRFNKFYDGSGTSLFKGFFEDQDYSYPEWINGAEFGSVILIVNGVSRDDRGLLEGEIWSKNYDRNRCNRDPAGCAWRSPTFCWMISAGPYECRDFLQNNTIQPAYPNVEARPARYIKLGTFQGLRKDLAFK